MWEAISSVLVSENALQTILGLLLLVALVAMLVKAGMIKVHTKHISVGSKAIVRDTERTIIREQCDWVHTYLFSLEHKLLKLHPSTACDGYFLKYILECMYDEIVKWITFNHIDNSEGYISVKQEIILCMLYKHNIPEEYRTPEFNVRVKRWVAEIIEKLIQIRKLYSKQRDTDAQ